IHSYAVTLGSLIDANAKKSQITAAKGDVFGVTYTGFGRAHYLNGMQEEIDRILPIIETPQVRCLAGEQATCDAAAQQVQERSWVHLACCGIQDLAKPTKSHLLLYGGNHGLETTLRMPPVNAGFAFLAACQTALGDKSLGNESFHRRFIAAGFHSAISTLWSIDDQDGPFIAEIFYSHLSCDGR
ncbi:hypothetical protein DFH09DRAFT_931756, partial [Mycena vulgaris]